MPDQRKYRIALGSDHAGFAHKEAVKAALEAMGHSVVDFGATNDESSDYPVFVRPAAEAVARGDCDLGVVFGGSGNGEQIAANKVKGIRCALCYNLWTARLARQHNNANVISIGGRTVSLEEAVAIVKTWLEAEFEGGRHQRRIDLLEPDEGAR